MSAYARGCDDCGQPTPDWGQARCASCKAKAEQEDARISVLALMGYPQFRSLLAGHAAFRAWLIEHGLPADTVG